MWRDVTLWRSCISILGVRSSLSRRRRQDCQCDLAGPQYVCHCTEMETGVEAFRTARQRTAHLTTAVLAFKMSCGFTPQAQMRFCLNHKTYGLPCANLHDNDEGSAVSQTHSSITDTPLRTQQLGSWRPDPSWILWKSELSTWSTTLCVCKHMEGTFAMQTFTCVDDSDKKLRLMYICPCIVVYAWRRKPTRRYWMVYCTYDLLNMFRALIRPSSRMWMFRNIGVLQWRVVSTSPNPQAGGPPLVGCPRLLIQFVRNYPPYWRPFLYLQPEDTPCRGDRDPLHGFTSVTYCYLKLSVLWLHICSILLCVWIVHCADWSNSYNFKWF